jgi:TolA-binding protein
MSSPAETSAPQPSPTSAHTGFDPVEFWFLHQKKVIALAVLFIVGLVGYTLFTINENRSRAAADAAYASAKTADDFRKVAQEHSGQPAAGNAQLQLAALQRDEGKLDDANTTLRKFIAEYPEHPMLAGAWLALAENAEAAGKQDEALTGYQKVLTTFPSSYAAPLALLGQGRIQKAKGQNDLAKRTYEQIQSQFQGSPFQMEAMQELRSLSKPQ